jgi:hypothetical protein
MSTFHERLEQKRAENRRRLMGEAPLREAARLELEDQDHELERESERVNLPECPKQ